MIFGKSNLYSKKVNSNSEKGKTEFVKGKFKFGKSNLHSEKVNSNSEKVKPNSEKVNSNSEKVKPNSEKVNQACDYSNYNRNSGYFTGSIEGPLWLRELIEAQRPL